MTIQQATEQMLEIRETARKTSDEQLLRQLATGKTKDGLLIANLALNPALPLDLMEAYASHAVLAVRLSVVKNRNVTDELLQKLSKDSEWMVSSAASEALGWREAKAFAEGIRARRAARQQSLSK